MAGREKKPSSPAMSGPGKKDGKLASPTSTGLPKRAFKSAETQTASVGSLAARRPSLQPPPTLPRNVATHKRFSSPYTMRSESPVRILRNGKQQKLKDNNMLDGIPITKKRTRSIVSESDTTSLFSASFNDTASVDFNSPDFDSRSSSFLSYDSIMLTPRRNRTRTLNSETCSLVGTPLPSPGFSRQKKDDDVFSLPALKSNSRKSLSDKLPDSRPSSRASSRASSRPSSRAGSRMKQPLNEVKVKQVGKRKMTKEQSEEVVSNPPVKKVRKNAKQSPSVVDEEAEAETSSLKQSPVATTSKVGRKKKILATKLATTKVKKGEITANKVPKKTLLSPLSKSRQKLAAARKIVNKGKGKGGRPLKMAQQQLALKLSRTRGNNITKAKNIALLKNKKTKSDKNLTIPVNSVYRRRMLSIMYGNISLEDIAKEGGYLKKTELNGDLTTTATPTQVKKKVGRRPKALNTKVPLKKEEENSEKIDPEIEKTELEKPVAEVRKLILDTTKASFELDPDDPEEMLEEVDDVENKTNLGPAQKKTKKVVDEYAFDPDDSPLDGETLKTLTQVSKILKKFADTPLESADDKNVENENKTNTSAPNSPKITTPLKQTTNNTEMNGVAAVNGDAQKDASHVSPINSLASKLRRKLSQSPSVTSPTDLPRTGTIETTTIKPTIVLPIINSLSAAAKQTSSFKNCNDDNGPVTRKETQWKVNKRQIYDKIKTNKSLSNHKINTALANNILNKPSRRVMVTSVPLASVRKETTVIGKETTVFGKETAVFGKETTVFGPVTSPVNKAVPEPAKTDTVVGNNEVLDEATLPTENAEATTKTSDKVDTSMELDSNENKVETKSTDQQPVNSEPAKELEVKESEPEKETAKPNTDNSQSLDTISKSNDAIPEKEDKTNDNHSNSNTNVIIDKSNLDSEKTEKETIAEKDISIEGKENEKSDLQESSSKVSEDTENSVPQVENKDDEAKKQPEVDDDDDDDFPTLRMSDSAATTPMSSPVKLTGERPAKETEPENEPIISEQPGSSTQENSGASSSSESQSPTKNLGPVMFEGEDLVAKVSVLGALGLQSNQALSEQAKAPKVPKLRLVCRPTHKKHRRSTNSDASTSGYKEKTYTVCREGDSLGDWDPSPLKTVRDPTLDPCSRSLLWYPRMPISNGKTLETLVETTVPEQPGVGVGDGLGGDTTAEGGEKSAEPLVIPEKSSSFAIHPGRLCEDVCCYCHNKFGLYDTPLHVAQLKGEEKQQAVLAREPLLTLESCLCDACFRHLDRPGPPRCPKPPSAKAKPQPNQQCCFNGCQQVAAHPLMRKWKRRVRSLIRHEQQDPKTTNWVCETHYTQIARVSACGMCLRRNSSQQMYQLEGSAVPGLNQVLLADSIPVQLDSSSYLCKKCRFYASLRLRSDDYMELNTHNRQFLRDHRGRVLKVLNVDPGSVPELFLEREKPKKLTQKKKSISNSTPEPSVTSPTTQTPPPPGPTPTSATSTNTKSAKGNIRIKLSQGNKSATPSPRVPNAAPRQPNSNPRQPSTTPRPPNSNPRQPSLAPRPTLAPKPIAPKPIAPKLSGVPTNVRGGGTLIVRATTPLNKPADKSDVRRVTTQGNHGRVKYSAPARKPAVSILPRPPLVINTDVQDPYSFVLSPNDQSLHEQPLQSQKSPQEPPLQQQQQQQKQQQQQQQQQQNVPSASDVAMNSTFEFQPLEQGSMWQKVNATFQFDKKTRQLWHQLHAPYGSYTSFLRHLVLLETHWRNGDLGLTADASQRARQYLGSVQNRIQAYESVPTESEGSSNVPLIYDVRSLATGNNEGWNV